MFDRLALPVAYPDCGTPPHPRATFKTGRTRLPDRAVHFSDEIINWQACPAVYEQHLDLGSGFTREVLYIQPEREAYVRLDYHGHFCAAGEDEWTASIAILLQKDLRSPFSECKRIKVVRYVMVNRTEMYRRQTEQIRKRRVCFTAFALIALGVLASLWRLA